jgi:serine/threonine protein kinase
VAADSQDHTVVVHVMPGEVLAEQWRIESRVGQGAMGSVFRGRDLKTNGVVAVKILAPEHCRKPRVLARFEREAETMTTLRHPNIVQLYGHGRRGALPFIVMEFLEGLTLGDVMTKNGALGVHETVAVVKQVAAGLSFLHHHGLVHRDVKPHNIVIGVGGRVTILDLGVVRDQANPGLTRPGAMVGTPYYMSPEQIYGVDDIDKRTDVYALAAMTFEMLTGRPPFLGNNNFEVLYGHKTQAPPDAAALVRSLPKGVSQAIARGMAKKREERPASATEFVADVEAAAGAKKVDLGKAFAAIIPPPAPPRKVRQTLSPPAKPPPPVATASNSGELPLASDDDVKSVESLAPPQPRDSDEDLRTVTIGPEAVTAVRREFERSQRKTSTSNERTRVDLAPVPVPTSNSVTTTSPVEAGELEISARARGKAVRAQVFVDDVNRGLCPMSLLLSAGEHELRVEFKGYAPYERMVTIAGGEPQVLTVSFD